VGSWLGKSVWDPGDLEFDFTALGCSDSGRTRIGADCALAAACRTAALALVRPSVAGSAKGNQVLFAILPGPASVTNMVYVQLLKAAAGLAPPAIAIEDLMV
jgi:hypothetical protein